MNDIQKLIAAIQAATRGVDGGITINLNLNQPIVAHAEDDVDNVPTTPYTDFEVDDRVLICHIRKNGDRVHCVGTVDTVLGHDDKGWYTRVTGDNGKHYRAGLRYNEERLGTVIYQLD